MSRPFFLLMLTCAVLCADDRSSPNVESEAQEARQANTAAEQKKQIETDDHDRATAYDEAKEKAEFEKQDKALNAAYAEMKKTLNPELFEKLRTDQREWVKDRAYKSALDEPDRIDWSVAANITAIRIDWIKAWAMMSVNKEWTGHYTDGRGGLLDVVENDGRYYFRLVTERYYGSRGESTSGSIEGRVRVNGSTGWFETKTDEADEPTWLTFLRDMDFTNSIRLAEENTLPFSSRAGFKGTYLWVRELSAQERNELLKPKK